MKMISEEAKKLRTFGLVMTMAGIIIGSTLLWRSKPIWPYIYGLSAVFLVLALTFPRLLKPIEAAWMKLARAMGQIMTRIVLSVTFYLILTPVGLIMRLFGHDPMKRGFDRNAASYWTPVEPDGPAKTPDKPY